METVIDFRAFDAAYITGLVFSIFEGLNHGESFRIITADDPKFIRKQFIETEIGDFQWEVLKVGDTWNTKIFKLGAEKGHGSPCCGVCGG